jgi:hypothetical protein
MACTISQDLFLDGQAAVLGRLSIVTQLFRLNLYYIL